MLWSIGAHRGGGGGKGGIPPLQPNPPPLKFVTVHTYAMEGWVILFSWFKFNKFYKSCEFSDPPGPI